MTGRRDREGYLRIFAARLAPSRRIAIGLTTIFSAVTGGCQDYHAAGLKMGPYDYDIHRFNRLVQEAEPASPNHWQTFIAQDGARAGLVYERYRSVAAKVSSTRGSQQSNSANLAGQASGGAGQ